MLRALPAVTGVREVQSLILSYLDAGIMALLRDRLCAHHICTVHDTQTLLPRSFVHTIYSQLCSNPIFGAEYTARVRLRQTHILSHAISSPDTALIEVLKPLRSIQFRSNSAGGSESNPVYILVDSLDEALTVSGSTGGGTTGSGGSGGSGGGTKTLTITDLICNELVIGALPVWCRFVCTTRPETAIRFTDSKSFVARQIDATSEDNRLDVANYIASNLRADIRERPSGDRPIARVTEYCNGNFLIAHEVVSALNDGHMKLSDLGSKGKPLTNISTYYHRLINDRVLAPVLSENEMQRERAGVILSYIIYFLSDEGDRMFDEAVTLELRLRLKIPDLTRREISVIYDRFKPCTRVVNNKTQLYHRSMGEWIRSVAAGPLQIDIRENEVVNVALLALVTRWVLVPTESFPPKQLMSWIVDVLNCKGGAAGGIRSSEVGAMAGERALEGFTPFFCMFVMFTSEVIPSDSLCGLFAGIVSGITQLPAVHAADLAAAALGSKDTGVMRLAFSTMRIDPLRLYPELKQSTLNDEPLLYNIGNAFSISCLIKDCAFDPNRKFTDSKGRHLTPLHVAKNGEVVRALIAGGARLSAADYKSEFRASPLYSHVFGLAASRTRLQRLSAIAALVEAGASLDFSDHKDLTSEEQTTAIAGSDSSDDRHDSGKEGCVIA